LKKNAADPLYCLRITCVQISQGTPRLFFLRALLLTSLLVLSACSGLNTGAGTGPAVTTADATAAAPTAEQLLQQASTVSALDAAPLLLQAATLLSDQGDLAGSLTALDRINAAALTPTMRTDVALLKATVAMSRNLPREALTLLQVNNLPAPESMSPPQRVRYHEIRATAQAATGASLVSALERIALDPLLTAVAQRNNHDLIWQALSELPQGQLQALSATASNPEIRGWYDLALVARSYSTDMDRQLIELQRWRAAWATHPAAIVMAPQMELIETLARERPQQVALLLPLGTSAGSIVRDAFMSAYFSLQELGGQVPVVKLYDVTDLSDIRPLHLQARQEGAQLIIGPLSKQHVAQLQTESDLGVPTLALNVVEGLPPASPQLYQFALSPEDEARQLAARAWEDGHRRVAILGPLEASGTDVAIRKRASFKLAWESLGGVVVANDSYQDNYTNSISDMLLLNASSDRHKQLSQLLGRTVVSDLRRRQDIDFIFLIAQPAPARQIIPSLAYLYAGDIPVYATQDLYAGSARQADDRDLNGAMFGESPWLLADSGDVARVRQLFPMNTAQNQRLQAFGVDAFRLYPRLRLLESGRNASIPGASGLLKLGANRTIERELSWATITDGLIKPHD
jgi:uncharacterized protein